MEKLWKLVKKIFFWPFIKVKRIGQCICRFLKRFVIKKLFFVLEKLGFSKKEAALIITGIYAPPVLFIPTIVAIIYIVGRLIFNFRKKIIYFFKEIIIFFKNKIKPQEL